MKKRKLKKLKDHSIKKKEIADLVKKSLDNYEYINSFIGSAGYFLDNGFKEDNALEKYAIVDLGKDACNTAKSIALTEYVLAASGYGFDLNNYITRVEERSNLANFSHKRLNDVLEGIADIIELDENEKKKLIDFGTVIDYISEFRESQKCRDIKNIFEKKPIIDELVKKLDDKAKALIIRE